MKKNENTLKSRFIPILGIIAGLLIVLLLYSGYSFWNKHRAELIENQKEQMLILTEAVANGMETEIVKFTYDGGNIAGRAAARCLAEKGR